MNMLNPKNMSNLTHIPPNLSVVVSLILAQFRALQEGELIECPIRANHQKIKTHGLEINQNSPLKAC
jgi:hypothetical protein